MVELLPLSLIVYPEDRLPILIALNSGAISATALSGENAFVPHFKSLLFLTTNARILYI